MLGKEVFENIINLSSTKKIVKRSYTQKKTGVKVTKEYSYSQSDLLFRKTKKGYKLIEKAWNKFEESISQSATSESERITLLNEARRIKKDILRGQDSSDVSRYGGKKQYATYDEKGGKSWNRIDVKSFASRLSMEKAEKYLLNMGIYPEDVVEYVYEQKKKYISVDELLNPGNWINDEWNGTTIDGDKLTLTIAFNYSGLSHIEVH